MTLRRIIRIEEIKRFKKPNGLCEREKENVWYLFKDMETGTTGLIPRNKLERDYEKMTGFSSNKKELYMEKIK